MISLSFTTQKFCIHYILKYMMFLYKGNPPLDGKLIPIVLFRALCQTASTTLKSSWHVAPPGSQLKYLLAVRCL